MEASLPPVGANIEKAARNALLAAFAPPAVITDSKGNILYIHGDTSLI